MTHDEYIKQIEGEIRKLNRIIDYKLMRGENYNYEAKEHRMLLQKIWKHKLSIQRQPVKSSFFSKFFTPSFQH
jgi:hypothetical protein